MIIKLLIQVQSNLNKMFESKKVNEIKTYQIVVKEAPKKQDVEGEQMKDKLDIFNEIDMLIS